jgi:ferredoxin-NADP reductase
MNVTLVEPPETDAEGNTRSFSIASAPFETDLTVATRMRDTAFKRVLKAMPPGSEVSIAGPFGSFTLRQNSRPAAFLAGGIGVTPFRSILLQAAREKLPRRLFLFYSNRRPEDAPFLEELLVLEAKTDGVRVIGTMTDMQKSRRPWQGEIGYITREILAKYVGDLAVPIYYSAGPPGLVAAMQKMLSEAGINDDDILTEEFAGY